MKTIFTLFLALFTILAIGRPLLAQPESYAITNIKPELLKGAYVVKRMEENHLQIMALNKLVHQVKVAYTILNEKGKDYAIEEVHYDGKITQFDYLEGSLFDAHGKLLKKLKKSEISDVKAFEGDYITDNRQKIADLSYHTYPYTVEFSYQVTQKATMHLPRWTPVIDTEMSVVQSRYSLKAPLGLEINYREFALPTPGTITKTEAGTTFEWTLSDFACTDILPQTPSDHYPFPHVLVVAKRFQLDGMDGDLSSWEAYGHFIRQLNYGRDQLPPDLALKVKELTQDAPTDREKVRRIYHYLQENTRYVFIAMGIGGWQPFPVATTHAKKYGDCKGLTFYTQAMLQEAGIRSHYTLVRAGRNQRPIEEDFPNAYFNHAFLCVPMERDTIWLECTSQTNPFGYLGSFTSDRNVLLITETGGKLVRTPAYHAEDNLQIRKATVHLDKEGHAQIQLQTLYTGLQQDVISSVYANYTPDQLEKYLYKNISLPTFELKGKKHHLDKKAIPEFEEKLDIFARKFASVSGKRMFLKPNMFTAWEGVTKSSATRTIPFQINMSYVDIDTIVFHVPDGYYPEHLPEKVELSSPFGEFESWIEVNQEAVIYIRKVTMRKGVYPAEDYEAYTEFVKSVTKADAQKLVMVNKT